MSKISMAFAALGVVAGLGVAALPLSTHAADPVAKESTVQTEIKESLTLTLTGTDDTDTETIVKLGELLPDGDIVENNLTAQVKTNNGTGYKLTLADKDDNNSLVSGSNSISAGTPAKGVSAWGFKMGAITVADGATQSADAVNSYIAVPVAGSEVTIVNSNKPTKVDTATPANNGDTAVITFGASASSAQAAGTYSDVVVVTATANI